MKVAEICFHADALFCFVLFIGVFGLCCTEFYNLIVHYLFSTHLVLVPKLTVTL